jgi:uncharacterized protein (TIGR01619 family)
MDAAWESYLAMFMDKPAFVQVDTALAQYAPMSSHRDVVLCQIPVTSFRQNGLASEQAFKAIYAFEDAADAISKKSGNSIYVGRLGVGELVTFHYYAKDGEALAAGFRTTEALHSITKYRCNAQADAKWSYYFDFLYPTPETWNDIQNEKVRQALLKAGDDGTVARDIDHYAYFKTSFVAHRFAKLMTEQHYTIVENSDAAGDDGTWLVHFRKMEKPINLDAVTWEMKQQAERLGGSYDGWECPTVIPKGN